MEAMLLPCRYVHDVSCTDVAILRPEPDLRLALEDEVDFILRMRRLRILGGGGQDIEADAQVGHSEELAV